MGLAPTDGTVAAELPAASAQTSLDEIEIHSEISMMSGLQMPIVIGKAPDAGLPAGMKMIIKSLPKAISAFPNALRAEGGELRLPMTAADPKGAGKFDVVFILTRGKDRAERKATITLLSFDTDAALKTCMAIRPMPGQSLKLPAGRNMAFQVEIVNLNAQPIPIERSLDPTSPAPYDAGGVYRWIERLDGDAPIKVPKLSSLTQTDKFYGSVPYTLYKGAQLAPGTHGIVIFPAQIVGAQQPGKYRILFEYRTPADRNRKPGEIPAGPHSFSFLIEVTRP